MPLNIKQIIDACASSSTSTFVVNNTLTPTVSTYGLVTTTILPHAIIPLDHFFFYENKLLWVLHYMCLLQVKVIGIVRVTKIEEYRATFDIEDCTGVIKASIWFSNGCKDFSSTQLVPKKIKIIYFTFVLHFLQPFLTWHDTFLRIFNLT
jgi:hypothetical protein